MKQTSCRAVGAVVLSIGILGLAACGNGPATGERAEGTVSSSTPPAAGAEANGSGASKPAKERVFTDDYGREVRLTGTPKRVLAVYLEDPLVALGVKPLLQFGFGGSGGASYLQKQLADVPLAGTGGVALTAEQALEANPELIIAHSLVTSVEQVKQLEKIAPTYGLDANQSDWRAVLRKVGELLNLPDKAEQVLKDYDARTAAVKEQLKQKIGGETFALLRLTGKEYRLYGVDDPFNGALLYKDLGLTPHKLVREVPEAGGWSLSREKIPELLADHIILVVNAAGAAQAEELVNSSLWKNLPAAINRHVYEVDSSVWLSIGYMANSAKIDDLLSRVSR